MRFMAWSSRSVVIGSGRMARVHGRRTRDRALRVVRRASLRSDRLAAEPGDLVGVLVAAAGEADDQDLAGAEPAGLLERLGDGVARFEGGQDAFAAGGGVVGVEGLGVGDALVADAAGVLPVAVLGADAGVVEAGGDRVDVLRSGRRRPGGRS